MAINPAPEFPALDARSAEYLRLMDRIFAATTGPELLAVVPDILAYTGGTLPFDFGETWTRRWHELMGESTPIPDGTWPAEPEPDYEAELNAIEP